MKRLTLCLLAVLPFISYSQKKKNQGNGYVIISAGGIKFNGADFIAAGNFEAGANTKEGISMGVGVTGTKFKNDDNWYVPVYVELSYLKFKTKPAPYFKFQAGKGIYNTRVAVGSVRSEVSGGLYLSTGIGVTAPITRKSAVLISVNYVNAAFNSKATAAGITKTTKSNSDGISFNVGIALR